MARPSKYTPEFRERAVRLVLEQREEYAPRSSNSSTTLTNPPSPRQGETRNRVSGNSGAAQTVDRT